MRVLIIILFVLLMGFSPVQAENLGNSKFSSNCVKYVRSIVPELPLGLFTLWDKLKIVNSDLPTVGSVVIIDTGKKPGHVAYVKEIEEERIYIEEANWKRGKISFKWLERGDSKIKGYYLSPTLVAKIENERLARIEEENNKKMVVLIEQIQSFGRYAANQM